MFLLKYMYLICLCSTACADVATSFKQANIVPDPIKNAPQNLLGVEYCDGITVHLGTNLTSCQIVNSPTNYYVANSSLYYNLILIDIDATCHCDGRQFYVWGVGNIRGSDVSSGRELAPYLPPKLKPSSPPHRLVMMLYQQPGYIQYDPSYWQTNGRIFEIEVFSKENNFTGPVFGNFFYLRPDL